MSECILLTVVPFSCTKRYFLDCACMHDRKSSVLMNLMMGIAACILV